MWTDTYVNVASRTTATTATTPTTATTAATATATTAATTAVHGEHCLQFLRHECCLLTRKGLGVSMCQECAVGFYASIERKMRVTGVVEEGQCAERCPCPHGHAVLRHAFKHPCSHTHPLLDGRRPQPSEWTGIGTTADVGFDAQELWGGHPSCDPAPLTTSFGTVGQCERWHRAMVPSTRHSTLGPGVAGWVPRCDLAPQSTSFGTVALRERQHLTVTPTTRHNAICLCPYGTDSASLPVLQPSRQSSVEVSFWNSTSLGGTLSLSSRGLDVDGIRF